MKIANKTKVRLVDHGLSPEYSVFLINIARWPVCYDERFLFEGAL
ncbi:hypothetical protein [Massilia scottii]|nr:hypothetical protein [Massilia sp. CCM 9029]MDQ1833478.1 hypothetical protein [Massilia sp. CCM 9029]